MTERIPFDPTQTAIDLRIGAFDFEMTTILPDLVVALREEHSKTNTHAYPLTNRGGLDVLKSGQIDLAIGYFDFPATFSDQFVADKLVTERYVVAAHSHHPLLANAVSIKTTRRPNTCSYRRSGPDGRLWTTRYSCKGTDEIYK